MNKEYNEALQERLEQYLKREGISQAEAAPMIGISSSALSQYRRRIYEKGNIEKMEKKLEEFFKIKDEQEENLKKAEPYRTTQTYIPTSISESAYKLIRYCQLEKGIVVIDGDSGIGKTKAAARFLQDNPNTTIYLEAAPSTGTLRSHLKNLARALKLSDSQRTDDLSVSIRDTLRNTDKIVIIDEAQNLKFAALEEISRWTDEDVMTGKPGIGIVLIGNVKVYNRMLGKQEDIFDQQFNRSRFHGRYRTTDVKKEDVIKLFPVLKERAMADEISYLYRISHSKCGIRGAVNVFNNAVNNDDISLKGLETIANTMGIRFI